MISTKGIEQLAGIARKNLSKLLTKVAAASLLLLAVRFSAFAQCALCKSAIANSADAAKTAARINLGIILLLIPVLVILGAIIRLVYRYRDSFGSAVLEPQEQLLPVLDSEADSGLL
jgi:hypothetical protein